MYGRVVQFIYAKKRGIASAVVHVVCIRVIGSVNKGETK
jgi:hypothetical protein